MLSEIERKYIEDCFSFLVAIFNDAENDLRDRAQNEAERAAYDNIMEKVSMIEQGRWAMHELREMVASDKVSEVLEVLEIMNSHKIKNIV